MKLNDSYLCADCDEVFCYNQFKPKIYISDPNYPICPVCGNKNVLNLGRVLNRQEDKKDEESHRRRTDWCGNDPDGKHIIDGISGSITDKVNKLFTNGSNQGGDRRSRGTDPKCSASSKRSNGIIKAITTLSDVDRKYLQEKCNLGGILSGINADPV